jgi:hypothetical protein
LNIQEYISSGVIEAAALGIASEEEKAELQRLSLQYPEVARVRNEYAYTLERYASLHAVKPPEHLKTSIWKLLSRLRDRPKEQDTTTEAPRTLPRRNARRNKLVSLPRYAVAVSMALLLGSLVANLFLANRVGRSEDDLSRVLNERTDLVNEKNRALALQHQSAETLSGLIDPAVKPIPLNGSGSHSYCKAMVYWNSNSKDVFLSLTDLPAAPSGKQYQLWAIIDGQPVDAGMYEYKDGLHVLKMKKVDHAQMFAITLENTGGSPTPTLEQLYVAGPVATS